MKGRYLRKERVEMEMWMEKDRKGRNRGEMERNST